MPSETGKAPSVELNEAEGGMLCVVLAGDWLISTNPPSFDSVRDQFETEGRNDRQYELQVDQLGNTDSTLVSFLLQVNRFVKDCGGQLSSPDLDEGVRGMLALALAVPVKDDARREEETSNFFYKVGTASLEVVDRTYDLLSFVGELILSLGRLITGRARYRREDFWLTMQQCSLEALPIVTLISLLIGMILAFIGNIQLANFGASIYVADLVAIAMCREMGALMTAIIMSGRTGAAFAAQIGSMKVTQEIDALQTFGFDPVDFLVLPRMMALMVMLPLLTVYANFVGVAGGFIVGIMGGLSWEQYLNQTIDSLNFVNTAFGVFKSIFFWCDHCGIGVFERDAVRQQFIGCWDSCHEGGGYLHHHGHCSGCFFCHGGDFAENIDE